MDSSLVWQDVICCNEVKPVFSSGLFGVRTLDQLCVTWNPRSGLCPGPLCGPLEWTQVWQDAPCCNNFIPLPTSLLFLPAWTSFVSLATTLLTAEPATCEWMMHHYVGSAHMLPSWLCLLHGSLNMPPFDDFGHHDCCQLLAASSTWHKCPTTAHTASFSPQHMASKSVQLQITKNSGSPLDRWTKLHRFSSSLRGWCLHRGPERLCQSRLE